MKPITIGHVHKQSTPVSEFLTVPAMAGSFASFATMPPVFATAYLVAFMEWACIESLAPYLEPGERTVGTHVDISHVAATPIGMTVTARVELINVEGRKLRFKVECRDEKDLIGSGFHERAIIDHERFLARLEAKSAA
jgi:fluoroacetyl-CoA thioesterase